MSRNGNEHRTPSIIHAKSSAFHAREAAREPYFSWVSRVPVCPPACQGKCQSCFAISAVQCLEDRYIIAYGLKKRLGLSTMYALQCYEDHRRLDCASGGYALELCRQLETLGTVSSACWPDEKIRELGRCPERVWGTNGAVGCCADGCVIQKDSGGTSMYAKYRAKKGSTRRILKKKRCRRRGRFGVTPLAFISGECRDHRVDVARTTEAVAVEVRTEGPVVACFQVTRKMARLLKQASKSLLDQDTSPPPLGSPAAVVYEPPRVGTPDDKWISAHSASITGWAFDAKGRRFWQVRNSGAKGRGGYLYVLSSADYPPGTRRIGLDVPIMMQRSVAHGWSLWGGATALSAGDLHDSVRARVYARATQWCAILAGAALLLYGVRLLKQKEGDS